MTDQVANFKKVTVSTTYDASATSIVLTTGHGSELPDPSGDNFNLVWWDSTNFPDPSDDENVEIVRVTAKSSDTLTVTRNQEGSGASTKNTSGATYKMILSPTAKTITDLQSEIDSDIVTHTTLSNAHHTELHTIASHNDTTATGVELETLTDGSNADTLHTHAGGVPSDDAYDATGWNGNSEAATKNAIRDKIVTMDSAITTNTAKDTNVSTNLSEGTSTETTVDVNSSDGTNATLVTASTSRAGLLTKAKFDEIVANTAKVTNTTHTGEVTGSGALTIAIDAVTYDKMQDTSATDKILGRSTAGAGTIEEIACTAAGRAILDDVDASAQRTTLNVDAAGTDNSTDVTLNASATTGGMSIATQEISNRAATNAQTGYMTAALVTNIETNNAKNTNVSTDLNAGTRTATTIDVNSSDGSNATLIEADTTNAGILGSDKWDEIVANTSKITNATHTGDVTGATALTIGADKVLDSHINWGTGATQVSAVDLLIADAGVIITATEVEGALQENRIAIDLNTAKNTNVSTALSMGTIGASTIAITSDGGADDVTLPASTNIAAGMATASHITKLEGIATSADVTGDNVPQTHAMSTHTDEGALATLSTVDTAQIDADAVTYDKMQDVSVTDKLLGRSTAGAGTVEEISCTAAGRAILDDADVATQRTTLDVDQAGTDNSTDVTLAGTPNYITIVGQVITRNDVDLTTDITGVLPDENGGTGQSTYAQGDIIYASAADTLAKLVKGTDNHVLTMNGNVPNWEAATAGSQTVNIYLPAEAAYLPNTNPAGLTEELGVTTYGGFSYLTFDDTTSEHAIWRVPMPDYNGGNIIVTAFSKVATTPSGAVTLQYNILTIGLANSEAFDAASTVDTTVNISHSLNTTELLTDIMVASATIDPVNVASDDLMVIELSRDVASDNLSGDGELVGIMLEYTRT